MKDLIPAAMMDKYNNRTIRINKYVYTIRLYESFSTIVVEFTPVNKNLDEVTNRTKYNYPAYVDGSAQFRRAVEVAHDIAEEIEDGISVDYIVDGQKFAGVE